MATAIAFGALGAHALKNIFDAHSLGSWKTAVFYQVIHSLAIIIIVLSQKVFDIQKIKVVLVLMLLGVLLFSGSIYLLSLNYIWQIASLGKVLGPLTPIGGLLMLSSWLFFGFKISKK